MRLFKRLITAHLLKYYYLVHACSRCGIKNFMKAINDLKKSLRTHSKSLTISPLCFFLIAPNLSHSITLCLDYPYTLSSPFPLFSIISHHLCCSCPVRFSMLAKVGLFDRSWKDRRLHQSSVSILAWFLS